MIRDSYIENGTTQKTEGGSDCCALWLLIIRYSYCVITMMWCQFLRSISGLHRFVNRGSSVALMTARFFAEHCKNTGELELANGVVTNFDENLLKDKIDKSEFEDDYNELAEIFEWDVVVKT